MNPPDHPNRPWDNWEDEDFTLSFSFFKTSIVSVHSPGTYFHSEGLIVPDDLLIGMTTHGLRSHQEEMKAGDCRTPFFGHSVSTYSMLAQNIITLK